MTNDNIISRLFKLYLLGIPTELDGLFDDLKRCFSSLSYQVIDDIACWVDYNNTVFCFSSRAQIFQNEYIISMSYNFSKIVKNHESEKFRPFIADTIGMSYKIIILAYMMFERFTDIKIARIASLPKDFYKLIETRKNIKKYINDK